MDSADFLTMCRLPACVNAVVMLLSHSGEYPCECKNLIFAANSQKNDTIRALQMATNACEFLTNPCEFLTKLTIT